MPVQDDLGMRITTSVAQYLQSQIMNNLYWHYYEVLDKNY